MASSSAAVRPPPGLPILSGPPPIIESSNCRQCGKEFNVLWRRSHPCGHCGYEYCSTCLSDGQALMPRRAGSASFSSASNGPLAEIRAGLGLDDKRDTPNGYEVESVCTPCLSMLQVTSAPLSVLRSLPIKRLKEYLAAYNIPCIGPKEKEDFVQAAIKARNPGTGSLSPEAESYYRRTSVPKRGQLPSKSSSSTPARPPPPSQARPPPPTNQYRPSPASSANSARPPPPNYARPPQFQQARPPPHQQAYRPQPSYARPPPPRPANPVSAPAPAPAPVPPPPVPSILSLVSLPNSYLNSLSIGTLKAILYENHVKVDFKQVLEKNELISRVAELITAERKRLERQRYEEERFANGNATSDPAAGEGAEDGVESKKVPTGPMPEMERGLCVVCQDEEATLAVVDCGHLAMCQHCSELIMATSQECPLCRTRIVTPQRLIRIYRV